MPSKNDLPDRESLPKRECISFDALSLLLHHTKDGEPLTWEIVAAAEIKCGHQIDPDEAEIKWALLKAAMEMGDRWYHIAHELSTPDPPPTGPELRVVKAA